MDRITKYNWLVAKIILAFFLTTFLLGGVLSAGFFGWKTFSCKSYKTFKAGEYTIIPDNFQKNSKKTDKFDPQKYGLGPPEISEFGGQKLPDSVDPWEKYRVHPKSPQ